MKFIIGLIISVICICLAWACFNVFFISAEGGPGYLARAWQESPIATLVGMGFLIVCAIAIFGRKS